MKDSDYPQVSIVVPAYNEARYIESCLESLLELDYPKQLVTITVVDNGSSDNTVEKAKKYPVTVLVKKDGKVGSVRNHGALNSSGEILAFIDGDCVASKQWLKCAVNKLSDAGVGAVGGNYLLRENPSWVEAAWVVKNAPENRPTESLVGGSFLLKRSLFESFNGFDEEINAGEDTKLTKQVLAQGLGVYFLSECAVVHLGYPDDIAGFAQRQFWHSSSYLKSNTGLLKDKTFIFVLLFIFSGVSLLAFVVTQHMFLLASSVFLVVAPYIFGWHRLRKAGVGKLPVPFRCKVFLLDFLYFAARSAGLLASCVGDPFKN